jgi:L-fuconolactonase
MKTAIIDAHQHFWNYHPAEYAWIDETMSPLQRDFLPPDLRAEMTTAGVSGSIAVQARQTVGETDWLLHLAREYNFIYGVVGWAPIADPALPQILESLAGRPKLKGLRHVVQGEPDGFLARPEFNAGIAALDSTNLVYDILIFERQLPQAIQFVDRHPQQSFVLDHIAKPLIANRELAPWAANITEIARRPNVSCKLSGMVTEADWKSWTADSLQPYFDVVLQAFTPRRLMAGSDWPVCTVAGSYKTWFQTLSAWTASLSVDERQRILSGTAIEVYRLSDNPKELQ